MRPRVESVQPSTWQLQENGRKFPPNHLHHSWRDYLYWDTELETDGQSEPDDIIFDETIRL